MAPGVPASPATPFLPEGLLLDLLAVSLTGVNVLRPLYGPTGELADFSFVYINPAAQRMTRQPEQPAGTICLLFPESVANGVFDFYRRVFETGEADLYQVNYQADGLDNYFHVAARRSGEFLLASFTDTSDQDRSPVEDALRQSQARERAARAEAEARQAELTRLFEQSPVAISVFRGPAYVIELANAEMSRIWGRPSAQTVGRPVFEALPDILGQGFELLFADVLQHGKPCDLQEVPVTIDRGHTGRPPLGYFNLTYRPQYDAHGVITGIVTMATEVTDQVLARQQLEHLNTELEARVAARTGEALALQADLLAAAQQQAQARETFYQVFAQTPAAICMQRGPQHRYEYANQAYQDLFPGRALLGQPVAEALPETVPTGVVDLLDHVYRTGETYYGYELPLLITQPGGAPRQRYFTFTYQAYREQGQIVGIATFAYDVAAQVLARQAQEAQRQRLFALFEQAPVGICSLSGPDLIFAFINPGFQQLLPEHALLGRSIFDVLPELEATSVATMLRRVYATGETHEDQSLAIPIRRPSNGVLEERSFTSVYQAERGEQGQITGVLAFVFEVTEQVRDRQHVQHLNHELTLLNAELQESNRQLTRTNVDLDTFVYTASHDLKAPITNIESIVLALRDTLPLEVQQDELVAHLLHLLNQTVARFQFTITQLTDISRLQLAHVGPAELVALATVVQDVRLDLMPTIAAAAAQLTVAVPAELVVSFSPANLRSIVYNLLSNAVKYRAPERPAQVQVRAEQTPQGMVLTVQDNGLGMSEGQQRQLFGLFQRLHTHVEGTGVGLYITKRLIENAGGTISVQSQPNVGTTFTVTFPT